MYRSTRVPPPLEAAIGLIPTRTSQEPLTPSTSPPPASGEWTYSTKTSSSPSTSTPNVVSAACPAPAWPADAADDDSGGGACNGKLARISACCAAWPAHVPTAGRRAVLPPTSNTSGSEPLPTTAGETRSAAASAKGENTSCWSSGCQVTCRGSACAPPGICAQPHRILRPFLLS